MINRYISYHSYRKMQLKLKWSNGKTNTPKRSSSLTPRAREEMRSFGSSSRILEVPPPLPPERTWGETCSPLPPDFLPLAKNVKWPKSRTKWLSPFLSEHSVVISALFLPTMRMSLSCGQYILHHDGAHYLFYRHHDDHYRL